MSNPWNTVGEVSGWFSLAAFAIAAVLMYNRHAVTNETKRINSLPEDQRIEGVNGVLRRYAIDVGTLSKVHRYNLAMAQLESERQRLTFRFILTSIALLGAVALWGLTIVVDPGTDNDGEDNPKGAIAASPGAAAAQSSDSALVALHSQVPFVTSHMRLFGAFQVPAIVFRQGTFDGPGDTTRTSLNFADAFRQWQDSRNPVSNAQFTMGPVGEQLRTAFAELVTNPRKLSQPLIRVGFGGDPKLSREYHYLDRWTPPVMSDEDVAAVQRDFPPGEDGTPSYNQVGDHLKDALNGTGYLFLQIDRKVPAPTIQNLQLHYLLYAMPQIGVWEWPTSDSIRPNSSVRISPARDSLKLPLLEDGRPLLLPLAVFRSNDGGYPSSFVSSVLIPQTLSWVEDGVRKTLQVEQPNLTRSAKIPVPMGWAFQ